MIVDIRIMYIALAATCFIVAAVLSAIGTGRPRRDGTLQWVLGWAVQGAYWTLLGLRGIAWDFVSIVIANTCLAASYSLLYAAVREFQGRSYSRHILLFPPAAMFLFVLRFSAYTDNLFYRSVFVSVLSILQVSAVARLLFHEAPDREKRSYQLTGFAFLAAGLLWLGRLIEVLALSYGHLSLVRATTSLIASILAGFGVAILSSMGFVLMIRERAEHALLDAEQRWATTLSSIGDAVIATDLAGKVTFMNAVAEEMTGWTFSEASMKPVTEVFHIINEHNRKEAESPVVKVLGEGMVVGLANHTILVKKSGTEVLIDDGGAPIRDVDGKTTGAVLVFRDRTEQRKAEQALKESKTRLDLALQSASMGVWYRDLVEDKRYIDDQACHLLGIDPATFTGAEDEFFEAVHTDDREMVKTALARTIEHDVPYEPEYRAVWPDGSVHHIAARGRLARDDTNNTPERINGIIWDITKRKKMEEILRASLKERDILIKEIHHRVKNNLQIISSMISLQSNYVEDVRVKELFRESADRVYSMARIHTRLYQSGDYSHIDFGSHVRDLCAQFYASYRLDTDSIALDISAEDISVDINTAIPLSLIINELLSNAMKHAFPGGRKGTITVTLRGRLKEAAISVSDTGIGFPDSLDFRTTGSLGLQFVVQLVDQIGGSIEMSSGEGHHFSRHVSGGGMMPPTGAA